MIAWGIEPATFRLSAQYLNQLRHQVRRNGTALVENYLRFNNRHRKLYSTSTCTAGRDSLVGIATRYGLDGPEIECR
jgi:hypothetical protein